MAGAFQLNERSTKAIGAALSGSVSAASDVTFATFNPAALTAVEHFEMGGNVSLVAPISNGTVRNGPFAGQEVDADRLGIVPSLAIGYRVTDDLVIGFTNYSPFGLKTQYPVNWVGQADARTSELRTISFSPTISYDVLDNLTLGASFNILYADARLTNAAVNLDGQDVGFGFSVGALFEPIEGTRIGASYHHGYDLDIDTDIFGGLAGGIPESAGVTGVASASLPAMVQLGITQDITDDLRIMAEGRWINWSVFDSIDVDTSAGFGFQAVENYEDAFFVSLGAEYDINEQFTIRGGLAWDETPTTDAFRSPRVPDEDRLWITIGASYAMNESMSLDAGYAYLHALNDPVVTLKNGPAAGTIVDYDAGAHIFSIGGTMRF
jgi:long-chain fatty acid transport protein